MSIQTVKPSLIVQIGNALKPTDIFRKESDALSQEASRLCLAIILGEATQAKGDRITVIGSEQAMAICSKNFPVQSFGHYKKCRAVTVLLFEHNEANLTKEVQVKAKNGVILKPTSKDPESQCESFLKEGEMGMELNSIRGVVETYFYGCYLSTPRRCGRGPKKKPFIVSEKLQEDLFDFNEKRFERSIYTRLFRTKIRQQNGHLADQLIEILIELHNRGYFHRDLKPENILVDEKGKRLVIIDFEFAHKRNQIPSNPLGTLEYQSPEYRYHCFSGSPVTEEVLERNDIWALGSILYELFTNRSVFESLKKKIQYDDEIDCSSYAFYTERFDITKFNAMLNELSSETALQNLIKKILVIPPQKPPELSEILREFRQIFPRAAEKN